jgi:hypothetical protein
MAMGNDAKGRTHISAEVRRSPLRMKSRSSLLIHPPDSSAYDSARENHCDSRGTRSDAASASNAPVDEYNSVTNSGAKARGTGPKSSAKVRRSSMAYASFETSPFPKWPFRSLNYSRARDAMYTQSLSCSFWLTWWASSRNKAVGIPNTAPLH